MTIPHKYSGKVAYMVFLLLLNTTFLFLNLLSFIIFRRPSRKKTGNIILYPYAFKGSDGYLRRFEEYFPFLEKDGITYRSCTLFTDAYARRQLQRNAAGRYLFYLRILWKRIPQVIAARKYDAVFIQRGLFPVYFDLEIPHLENLLRKLNSHITVDIWDSIFERQPVLVNETIKCCDQLSVSNEFLANHFSGLPQRIILWKVAVNLGKYKVKSDYSIHGRIRLFWTGLPHNLPYLLQFLPVLKEVAASYPLTLVVVCMQSPEYDGLSIEHHLWEPGTFFDLLNSSDIGIYPEFNSVVSKGKSTMKVMDYMATGLPMVGVPYGLPSEAAHERELLIAGNLMEWKQMLIRLIQDEQLRKTLGQNSRIMMERYYSLNKSYHQFKSFALPIYLR